VVRRRLRDLHLVVHVLEVGVLDPHEPEGDGGEAVGPDVGLQELLAEDLGDPVGVLRPQRVRLVDGRYSTSKGRSLMRLPRPSV